VRASLEVADIFRAAGPAYRAAHAGHLSLHQLKVMPAIEHCRTAADALRGKDKDFFTWAILKAHTKNAAGTVMLQSADPRDPPEIDFHYFNEGNDTAGEDLASVVAGVEYARKLTSGLYGPGEPAAEELIPGPAVRTQDDIGTFVRDEAWGHHASCTNRMGPPTDPLAVADSEFRVYGTQGLRVVDASVFPRIPGYFIVTPIYMISEKASDVILGATA
jgi:choline dehydrogenase